ALTQRVEVAPHDRKTHYFGFAGARRKFECIFRPSILLRIHAKRGGLGILAREFRDDSRPRSDRANFVSVDEGFDCFALAEEISERHLFTAWSLSEVIALKPMMQ